MSADIRNIVLCISFGHESRQVSEALAGAISYAEVDPRTAVIVVDDASGNPPSGIDGALLLETPTRRGFAGAVNYVLEKYRNCDGRLLLINPDAGVSFDAVSSLLADRSEVAVPRVLNPGGVIENIRRATSASEQFVALLIGERHAARMWQRAVAGSDTVVCPPFAPSGSVISYPVSMLRDVPLRTDFFWLEQSDWVLRYAEVYGPINVAVLPVHVTHTGASTSMRYPVSVAASQLRTKVNFITEYGSIWVRLLTPLAVLSRSLRFAAKTRRLGNGWFLMKVAAGLADWRVSK